MEKFLIYFTLLCHFILISIFIMVVGGGHYMYAIKITSYLEINKLIDLGIIDVDKSGLKKIPKEDGELFLAPHHLKKLKKYHETNNTQEFISLTRKLLENLHKLHKIHKLPSFSGREEEFIKYATNCLLLPDIGDSDLVINLLDEFEEIIPEHEKLQQDCLVFYDFSDVSEPFYWAETPHESRHTDYDDEDCVIYFGVGTYINFEKGLNLTSITLDTEMFDKFCSEHEIFQDKQPGFEFFPDDCNCCS